MDLAKVSGARQRCFVHARARISKAPMLWPSRCSMFFDDAVARVRTEKKGGLRAAHFFYIVKAMTRRFAGSLELLVLLSVARLEDEAYGITIRDDVSERSGRDYSVGAVYTTLQRLEDKDLLVTRFSDPLPTRGGRARRYYSLSTAGRRALREAEQLVSSAWSDLSLPRFRRA
jgi:PadR family transcriptional regulator PadR